MDGGGDQGAAETRQRDLGDGLEGLLDQLARSGLKVGPRERVAAAALVASLTASGAVRDFKDLAPLLAPLLARSPEERRSFHQVLAAYAPGSVSEAMLDEHAQARAPTPVRQSRWWLPVAGLAVIAAGVVTAFVFWPAPPDIVKRPAQTYERSGGTFTPAPPIKESAEAAPSDSELLDRIIKAADRFEGAPTLDELSLPLARSARITGWPAESFALRLQELTGLPRAAPLPLYADDGAVLARIAHALERIERPGREPPLARFAAASAKLVAARKPETVYELAALLPDWLSGETPQDKDALIALIQRRFNSGLKGRDEAPTAAEAIDRLTVERALAITADPTVRRIYDDAPWLSPAAPGLAGAALKWVWGITGAGGEPGWMEGVHQSLTLNCSRARNELGWRPLHAGRDMLTR